MATTLSRHTESHRRDLPELGAHKLSLRGARRKAPCWEEQPGISRPMGWCQLKAPKTVYTETQLGMNKGTQVRLDPHLNLALTSAPGVSLWWASRGHL